MEIKKECDIMIKLSSRELKYLKAAVASLPNTNSREDSTDGEYGFSDIANDVYDTLNVADTLMSDG